MTDAAKSMTTPDPITTAHGWTDEVRQAVTALEDKYGIELISGPHHAKWVEVACYEIGGGAIRMYKDDVEKLKAERDEWKSSSADMGRQGIKLMAEITRLTSQLEQAERVIKPFKDVSDTLHSGYDAGMAAGDKPTARVSVSDLRAASQWIRDRQAKGEG